MRKAAMSYRTMVTRKASPAILSEVNFNILMKPTTMHMHTASLTMMLCWLYHQPTNNPMPTHKLTTYSSLNSKAFILKIW